MNNTNDQGATAALMAFMGAYFLVIIAVTAFVVFCLWKICTKAGFSGWLSLLALVPCGNVVLLIVLAFMEWPVERQVKMMGGGPFPGPGPGQGPGNYYRPPDGPPMG